MDATTQDVRCNYWQSIIEQCMNRPEGQSTRSWLLEHEIKEKPYYYWLRKFRTEAYPEIKSDLPTCLQPAEDTVTFTEVNLPVPQPDSAIDSEQEILKTNAVVKTHHGTVSFSNAASSELIHSILEVMIHA